MWDLEGGRRGTFKAVVGAGCGDAFGGAGGSGSCEGTFRFRLTAGAGSHLQEGSRGGGQTKVMEGPD